MVKALSLDQSERRCTFTCSPLIITGNTQREVQMEDLLPLTADRRMVATFWFANIFPWRSLMCCSPEKKQMTAFFFYCESPQNVELQAFQSRLLRFRFSIVIHEVETRLLWWRECKKRREWSVAGLAQLSCNWVSPVSFSTYFRSKFFSFSSTRNVWKCSTTNNTNE